MDHTAVKEFRLVLPLRLSEFEKAQIHTVTEGSKKETGGGGGIEVMENRPFPDNCPLAAARGFAGKKGHYTKKMYHLEHHTPTWAKLILRRYDLLDLQEDAWNAYPLCKTVISAPKWKPEELEICITSLHVENDDGDRENAHGLTPELLALRSVVKLDITDDKLLNKSDYKASDDPKKVKTSDGRGPWESGWSKKKGVLKMCAYKLVLVRLKWRLFEGQFRDFALNSYPRIFCKFHRQAVCSFDAWNGKSLTALRAADGEATAELERLRKNAAFQGTTPDDAKDGKKDRSKKDRSNNDRSSNIQADPASVSKSTRAP